MTCQEVLDLVISQHMPNRASMMKIHVFKYNKTLFHKIVQEMIDLAKLDGTNYQWFVDKSKLR